nr:hypothetical protein [Polaromonas sp.]
ALRYHSQLDLQPADAKAACPYLVVNTSAVAGMGRTLELSDWERMIMVRRPADRTENVVVFRRVKSQ